MSELVPVAPTPTSEQPPVEVEDLTHGDRILTVPNAMTAFRGIMGVLLPVYMARGGKLASIGVGLGSVSDLESPAADAIDKKWPGWGRSKLGKRGDPIVDTEFGAGLAVGVIISPKTSRLAKAGAVLTAIKVGIQTIWAVDANRKHLEAFGNPYVADVGMTGKTGTAFMLAGIGLGVLTGDLNPAKEKQRAIRDGAGIGAVLFAAAGLVLGELARKKHDQTLKAKLAAAK